jgi:bacitracin synthase 1
MMDVGHVAYAGASAFLDAFAQHRASADNGVVMSINWGAWQDVGGAMELAKKHARALGLSESRAKIENGILSGEGMDVFGRIMQMESPIPQVVVYPQDLIEAVNRSRTLRIGDKGGEKPAPGRGVQRVQRPSLESEYVPAGNEIEETLVETWGEFFGFDRIGIRDDFFELGGDSLKAITMVNKIREKLDVEIGLNDLFLSPTIEKLAGQISGQLSGGIPPAGRQGPAVKYPPRSQDLENIGRPFPLTPIQAAYFLGRTDQFDMGSISTQLYLEVATRFDARRLNRSLNQIIARHPMMRAVVNEEGEQKILDEIPGYEIKVEDLRHMDADEQQKRILSERERMSQQVFDLGRWPLFEIKGMRLSHEDLYIFLDFDMFIGDGYSFQIIIGEWVLFYNDPGFEPEPLEFTFRDYVLASRELRDSDIYAADKEYWLNKLEDFPSPPALPIIRRPSEIKEPSFKKIQRFYPGEEWEILRGIAQKNNITPSVLLCAVFAQVLAYWSNQRKFAVNLPLFNRYPFHKDVDKLVGNFTSVLLLEVDWDPGSTVMEAAVKMRETLMEAMEHRHYDGVEFMREISRYKNLFTQAVMPVVFNSTIVEGNRPDADDNDNPGGEGLEVKMRYARTSQVYLEGHAALRGNKLEVNWGYVEELYDPGVIAVMFDQYTRLIDALIEGDTDCKPQLPERDLRLWETYNNTAGEIPGSLLHGMFTRQAALTPGNIALEYGDDILTYRQLDERSNRVARYLKEQGVGRNHNAAVITTRSFETMINVMGILKAGAAYVPIDPDYPGERQNYIFENSDCRLLLEPELYRVQNLERYPAGEVKNSSEPGDLAYVIYTSGSTGRPKGVMITHRQAANTIIDINRKFNVNETDRVMGISSMCFDLSVYDVFGSFSTGAALVLIPTRKDVDVLIETLENKKITFWNSVPAILDMVVKNLEENYVNDDLTRALLSGDWIPLTLPGKVKKHFPNCRVISLGGATEGSIWSIYYPVTEVKKEWKSIPYGYPLVNQTFYVLNFRRELCPVGVAGELYIGGDGVAAGYMNDEEKTGNSFPGHPVFGRIYKTGDYGVFHRDGYIEFLGRKDHQVKIRGYRVELGEIEACLLEHEQVKGAVVVDRTNASGSKYLCAYIVPGSGMDMDMETAVPQFKEFLSQKLPDYMVPSFFIPLESIPLTPNGKVNRGALPDPQEEISETIYEAPANRIEETLVALWQELLDVERVGVRDNFFELGGDSLKATTFVSRVRKALQVKIPLAEVFHLQRIRELAEFIKEKTREQYIIPVAPVEAKEFYELASAQKRLYVIQSLYPESTVYNVFQAYYADGAVDKEKLQEIFRLLIKRHEALRTSIEIAEEKPVQKIHEEANFEIEYYESGANGVSRIIKGFIRPFNLSQTPLLRVGLIYAPAVSPAPHGGERGGGRYILMVDMHHIITDAVSLGLFIRDFITLYSGNELPRLRLQYKDFSQWQNKLFRSPEIKQEENYWLERFKGDLPGLQLLTDYPRPDVLTFECDAVNFEIDAPLTAQLKELLRETDVTLYIVLLAVFNILLSKYSGQEDIIVGSAMAGRGHADLENIIGIFVNMLPLRNHPGSTRTFRAFLGEVKENALGAFENQDYQFDELVMKLGLKRDYNRNPLFNTQFTFQNVEMSGEEITGLKLELYEYERAITQFDLSLNGWESDNKIKMRLKYPTALFKRATAENMAQHYLDILSSVLKNKDVKIEDIIITHDLVSARSSLSHSESLNFKF